MVENERKINGASVLMTRREPETEEERNSYWYKAYASMEEAAGRLQKRVVDLERILAAQVRSNDLAGAKMAGQDELMQSQFGSHNDEMRGMAERIIALTGEVVRLGGDPDGV